MRCGYCNSEFYVELYSGSHVSCEARYCPWCGRALSENNDM